MSDYHDKVIHKLQTELDKYKWVSVKDKLPENNQKVLIYGNKVGDEIQVAQFDDGVWVVFNMWEVKIDDTTHWMPIPEPPPEDLALCRKLVSVKDSDAE